MWILFVVASLALLCFALSWRYRWSRRVEAKVRLLEKRVEQAIQAQFGEEEKP